MKRSILTLLLALLTVLALCACGGTAEEPAETAEAEETAETAEEESGPVSKLVAVYDSMDPETGVHMNYDVYIVSMDTTSQYDVHGKGGTYYARQSMEKYEGYDSIKFIQDGMFYTLKVRDNTGISMKGPSTDNAMITDGVYSAIQQCRSRDDFTVGEATLNGETYEAELFPAIASAPIAYTFCFDEAGNLVGLIYEANEDLGTPEMDYTIRVIDDQVDESLFDISGYTITEQ